MQTLKTAAIVVLLMTGIYGTYISLTTPPEPLPEEVQAMLDFDPDLDFAIDSGLPASLESFDVDEGTLSSSDMAFGQPDHTASQPAAADLSRPTDPPSPEVTTRTDLPGIDSGEIISEPPTESSPINNATVADNAEIDTLSSETDAPEQAIPSPAELALTSGMTSAAETEIASQDDIVQRANLATDTTTPNLGLMNAIETADRQFLNDKRRDALATLSIFYNAPNMTGEQRSQLLARLDPLAREVIYSQRHLLEQPHRVGQNETLIDVASIYQVPWQLLANINQINDPVTVLPGTELKVLRGPFRAEVHLETKELTLFLGDLYAGRFPIEIGVDPMPRLGTYTIQDKKTDKTYYDREGNPVPSDRPQNPFGQVWMDLGGMLSIHGSPDAAAPTNQGCISLAPDYAQDVYGILSQGSSITIRR